ncbi:MAG: hypothetical protein ABW077_04020 [Candidatus Thiodiazotropha endolucinida]
MQGKKKTRAQLEAENKLLRQSTFGKNVTSIILATIKYGAFVFFIYQIQIAVVSVAENLAGKQTFADIDINTELKAEGNLSLNDDSQTERQPSKIPLLLGSLGLAFGLIGIGMAKLQNKLRKDTVEKLQERIRSYEKDIDPLRSTSNLTVRGETRPEDK